MFGNWKARWKGDLPAPRRGGEDWPLALGPALISGHALAGVGRFRPTYGGPDRDSTEVDVDATINFTPRTRLGGVYRQGLTLSVLSTPVDEPTVFTRVGELRVEKDLWDRFDLQMYGRVTHLTTDGPVAILQPDGTLVIEERDDRSRQAGLNFGYTFRPDVRVGVDVSYTTRESNFGVLRHRGPDRRAHRQLRPVRRLSRADSPATRT